MFALTIFYSPGIPQTLAALLGLAVALLFYFARAAQRQSRELERVEAQLRSYAPLALAGPERAETADKLSRGGDLAGSLSATLLRLQDEERRRIARELHDSTAQALAALAVNLERLCLTGLDREAGAFLAECRQLLQQVTAEIRTTSYLLHPPILDDLGLEYALPWYIGGFSKRSGISVDLQVQPDLGRLPREVELALFRILQEALANVHRHAKSASVAVSLFRDVHAATLVIQDRGRGLPPDILRQTEAAHRVLGVGIPGMRERVRQLRGSFTLSNNPGTLIRVVLPLSSSRAAVA